MGNRVIKFRGKRVDNSEWVYGDYTRYSDENSIILVDFLEGEDYWVSSETVGQYTGLNDRDGVEIYEGDIVFIKGEDNKGTVVWDSEELEYGLDMENVQIKLGCFYGRNLEVIGNIYDNPELMDGR